MRMFKRAKSFAAVLLATAQLLFVLGFTMIGTAALTIPVQARDDFSITSVNILSTDNPLKRNSSISVEVNWSLPVNETMHDGDQFVFDLPANTNQNAALTPQSGPYTVRFESAESNPPIANGTEIGQMMISGSPAEGYRMITTFNNALNGLEGINGKVYFDATLNFQTSQQTQTYTLTFETEAQSKDFTITIPGENPGGGTETATPTSLIDKSAAGYDYANNQITWNLDVNQKAAGTPTSLASATSLPDSETSWIFLTDTIGAKQSYIPDSMKVWQYVGTSTSLNLVFDETDLDPGNNLPVGWLDAYSSSFVLKLPVGSHYKVTYVTQAILDTDEIPHSYSNAVTQEIDGFPSVGDSASITLGKIRKDDGIYDVGNDEIDWVVHVNPNRTANMTGTPTSLSVRDEVGDGHRYKDNTLKLYKVELSGDETEITGFDYTISGDQKTVTIQLPEVSQSTYYKMYYSTEITDVTRENYANTARMLQGAAVIQSDGGSITLKKLTKTNTGYDAVNKTIGWRIEVNQGRKAGFSDLTLEDTIDLGHKLLWDDPNTVEDENTIQVYEYALGSLVEIPRATWQTWILELSNTRLKLNFPANNYYRVTYKTKITASGLGTYANSAKFSVSGVTPWSYEEEYRQQSGGGTGTGTLTRRTLSIYKHDSTGHALQGVSFELYDNANNPLGITLTTGSDGRASVGNLPRGVYVLKEVSPLDGYVKNTNAISVDLTNADATKEIVNVFTKLTLFKKDAGTNTGLQGAVFELKDAQENGATVRSGIVTGSDGRVAIEGVPAGTYWLFETTPPAGHLQLTSPISVVISNEPSQQGVTVTIPNAPTSLIINKYDRDNKVGGDFAKVAGAEFKVYDSNKNELDLGPLVTDANGQIKIKGKLNVGSYYIKEANPPSDYHLRDEYIPFTINEEEVVLDVFNVHRPNALTIFKYKKNGEATLGLAGAVFNLKKANGDVVVSDITTDATGKAVISDVPVGSYLLEEKKPPEGYLKLTTPIPVMITNLFEDQGLVVPVENKPTKLTLYKHYGNLKLKDAEFELLNNEGQKMGTYTTDADGLIVINGLTVGNYTLVETKAPNGYLKLNAPLSVTILDKEVELDVKNVPIPSDLNRMLTIIKLVSDDTDVGKAFRFELRINGGAPTPITLSGAKSASGATGYNVTLPIGTPFQVREILNADERTSFDVLVNGIASASYSSTVSESGNTVSFLNRRFTVEIDDAAGLEGANTEMSDTNANQIPKTADPSAFLALGGALCLLLSALAYYLHRRLRMM